jgi:hypothetical protein
LRQHDGRRRGQQQNKQQNPCCFHI